MSDRPRIELSTVQIVSSMGAAVTGAVLTSYLGDGGTILGTAVGAGVSTTGFAVYKHYLARTKDKVAPVIVEHARQWSPTTQSSGHAVARGHAAGPARQWPDLARRSPARADSGQTGADIGRTPHRPRAGRSRHRPDPARPRPDRRPTLRRPGTTSGRAAQTSARPGGHRPDRTSTARRGPATARPGGPAPAGPGRTSGWRMPRQPSSARCGWAATAATDPTAPAETTELTEPTAAASIAGVRAASAAACGTIRAGSSPR